MRNLRISVLLLSLLLVAACGSRSNPPSVEGSDNAAAAGTSLPSATPVREATSVVSSAVTPTMTSSDTPTPVLPTNTPVPTITATPITDEDLSIKASDVYIYPVPAVYAGDKVTFQIWPNVPDGVATNDVSVRIQVDGNEIASGRLGGRSHLSGEAMGLFEWAWDTAAVVTGTHQVQVILDQEDVVRMGDEDPDNNEVNLPLTLHDPDELPANEANAIWKTAEIDCCHVHVVSRTAADRDLPELLIAVERAVEQAVTKLGEQPQDQFDIYLVDRVIGQGGYAGSEMVVSYLDRDYATNGLEQVLVHEVVHLLDRQFAPQRLAFLAEGLAVWASGGHYKSTDIDQAAAALIALNEFVPLEQLIDRFYPIQHETGYLEAAGLVNYLIEKYGWYRFRTFYGETNATDGETLVSAVERNLRKHYGIGLSELESNWRSFLEELPLEANVVADLRSTIKYYDIVRKYQQLHDPTAYFMLAWLPSPKSVLEIGNPADLTRHPESSLNITLEIMLQAAGEALWRGDYALAEATLDSVERVLDNGGHFIDPFSVSYWSVVQTATESGYEVQRVTLNGDQAVVYAAEDDALTLTQLRLVLRGKEWFLVN